MKPDMDAFEALRAALADGAMLTRDQAYDAAQRVEHVLARCGYAVLPVTRDACIMRESGGDRSTLRIRGLTREQARNAIDIIMSHSADAQMEKTKRHDI